VLPALQAAFDFKFGIHPPFFAGYIGLFVLGHLLHREPLRQAENRTFGLGVIYLAGVAITAYGTWVISTQSGQFSNLYYGYLTPNVMMMTLSLFLMFQGLGRWFEALPDRVVRFVVKASTGVFGVYLIHVFLMPHVYHVWKRIGLFSSPLMDPFKAMLLFFCSLAVIAVLQRIPVLRRLLT